MARRLFLTIMVLTAAHVGATAAQQVSYVVRPTGAPALHIELKFRGDKDGSTNLVLPNRWGGQSEFYKGVTNLVVRTEGARLSDSSQPSLKVIAHRPEQELHVEYDLVQDGPARTGQTRYRPAIEPNFFHCIGHSLWVRPEWPEDETVTVNIDWSGVPRDWTLANSFGVGQRRQKFSAAIGAFLHSVYTGGDFRVKTSKVRGKEVVTALRGTWKFTDDAFAEMVGRIVEVEREFWNDFSAPYYLVTMVPVPTDPGSSFLGGTGLTNSFGLFCSPEASLGSFRILLAHEYFHNWNSPRLGRMEQPEPGVYWFSEGFTDYYAGLLLLRAGIITLDEYVAGWNRFAREYYMSPARTEPNSRVIKDFWNDYEVEKLPYRRGFLLAANWNAEILRKSGGKASLDDAMRKMHEEAKGKAPTLNATYVDRFIAPLLGRSILPDIQAHIEKGDLIVPLDRVLGPDVPVEWIEAPIFELGLDLAALKDRKEIGGVVEGSAAYRAGLRNGQAILRRKPIYLDDPTKAIEITIKDGEGEQTITYLPVAAKGVRLPQMKLPADSAARARTLRWLGVPARG